MTGFIAIKRRSYETWYMRLALTMLLVAGLVSIPARSDASDLEQALKELHVQYQGEPRHVVAQRDGMTLAQAIESVRSRTGGRVVSAETRVEGGREVHYIKVLTKDGKVKTHKVNGKSR